MSRVRRALTQSSAGRFAVREEPIPPLGPGEILVEVAASVISAGTELGRFVGKTPGAVENETFRAFGYQNAGRVLEVGPSVTEFAVGQRVACMGAGYALHATHACVPVNMAVPLPDSISYERGAFVALAGTALHAVRRADIRLGEFALVMGLGVVGQLTAQIGQIGGAHVMAVDRFPIRLDRARTSGVHRVVGAEETFEQIAPDFTRGYGFDHAFICFGGDATQPFKRIVSVMKQAPDTHKYGRIVIVGGASISHEFAAALGNLEVLSAARTGPGYHDKQWERGASYPKVFVPWTTRRNLEDVVHWMGAGRLTVDPLISHRIPLHQGEEACRLLVEHPEQALGVVLTME